MLARVQIIFSISKVISSGHFQLWFLFVILHETLRQSHINVFCTCSLFSTVASDIIFTIDLCYMIIQNQDYKVCISNWISIICIFYDNVYIWLYTCKIDLTDGTRKNIGPTIMFIKLWDVLMVEQIFFLPQVKRSMIISNKLVYTSFHTSCRTT